MVVQKTICLPNLGAALWRAVCRCSSRIHSEAGTGSSCSAMTQHYPLPAPLLLYGRAGHLSLNLLCFSFTHTPYYLPENYRVSKALLFTLCLLQTRDRERCESSKWLSNLQLCYEWQLYSWCVPMMSDSRKYWSSHWYCDDMRLHCSCTVACCSDSRYFADML